MEKALEVSQLSYHVRQGFLSRKKIILDQISFECDSGKIYALVGSNGVGKTTLLHLILSLKFLKSGSIKIYGQTNTKNTSRKYIGYIPERPYLPESQTASGFLRWASLLSDGSQWSQRIQNVLIDVGLWSHRKLPIKNYSKGMLQRLLIAQALYHDPKLILMDEPFSGLDPEGAQYMKELILKLKDEGKTILLTTHSIQDMQALADDLLILKDRKIKYFGPSKEYFKK